jgi:Resolvase, N terminal domain
MKTQLPGHLIDDYARVSTNEQETATQVAALKAAGCERIYREKASGGRWDGPELHRLLDELRKKDVLVAVSDVFAEVKSLRKGGIKKT